MGYQFRAGEAWTPFKHNQSLLGAGSAPAGPAGGDLAGNYPDPELVDVVTPGSFTNADITIDAKGRVIAAANGVGGGGGAPSGPAGGDLTGAYPNPTLVAVMAAGSFTFASITVDAKGRITAAANGVLPTTLPPSGPAGGDLAGTYPNPTLVPIVAAGTFVAATITIDAAGRVTAAESNSIPSIPATLPPSGPAGGDLAGTYPNPTLAPIVAAGSFTNADITIDAKGRVTAAANGAGGGGGSGTVNVGVAGQVAYYAAATAAVSPNPILSFLGGIATFDLSTGALPAVVDANTMIRLAQVDGRTPVIETVSYGGSGINGLNIEARIASGTRAAPGAVLGTNAGIVLQMFGYDGAAWSGSQGQFSITASGAWTTTAHATQFFWAGTPAGSLVRSNWMNLTGTGLTIQNGLSLGVTGNCTVTGQTSLGNTTNDYPGQGLLFLRGITKGLRMGTNATGAFIDGVDNTGTASFQPVALGGSTVMLQVNAGTIATVSSTGIGVTGNIGATGQIQSSNPAGDNNFLAGPFAPSIKLTDTLANPNGATRTTGWALATAAGHFGLNDGEAMWWNLGANRGNLIIDPNFSGGGAARQLVVRSAATINSTLTVASGNAIISAGNLVLAAGGVYVAGGSFAQGSMYYSPSLGLVIGAKVGTVFDFSLYNPGGTVQLIANETGTQNVTISGGVGRFTSTGLGVTGNILATSTITSRNGYNGGALFIGSYETGGVFRDWSFRDDAGVSRLRASRGSTDYWFWDVAKAAGATDNITNQSWRAQDYLIWYIGAAQMGYVDSAGLVVAGRAQVNGNITNGLGGTSSTQAVHYINGGSGAGGGGVVVLQANGSYQGLFGTSNCLGGSDLSPCVYAYGSNHFYVYAQGTYTADFWNGGLTIQGQILATGNITAYYSDDRLKTRFGNITGALAKVRKLDGFYYEANEVAQALGYKAVREVGLSAQRMQEVLPEVVAPAPIDEQYLTIRYERVVPLLVEAIKELASEFQAYREARA